MRKGEKYRLPEMLGYVFLDGGIVNAAGEIEGGSFKNLTSRGTVVDLWSDKITAAYFMSRDDWKSVNGLSFSWALAVMGAGKKVRRKSYPDNEYLFKGIGNNGMVIVKENSSTGLQAGWWSTVEDILAIDWELFEE